MSRRGSGVGAKRNLLRKAQFALYVVEDFSSPLAYPTTFVEMTFAF